MIRRGEGSPYEINLAFAAAAQKLGFEAKVVLVRDRRDGAFEEQLIGWLPTEAITVVQPQGSSRKMYFNPASRFAIARNVPWYLRGGSGLVAGSGNELILRVSPDIGAQARADWDLDLTVDASGEITGKVGGAIRGEQARSRRAWLWSEDPKRWPELVADDLVDDPVKLEVSLGDLSEPPDSAFKVSGSVRYPGITSAAGKQVSVPIEKLVPWRLHGDFPHERRSQPISFNYPRIENVTIRVHFPAGASIEDLPAPGSFQNSAGSWTTQWTRTDDGVRLDRTVEVRFAEFPRSDYDAVRNLFSGLASADREVLLIRMP